MELAKENNVYFENFSVGDLYKTKEIKGEKVQIIKGFSNQLFDRVLLSIDTDMQKVYRIEFYNYQDLKKDIKLEIDQLGLERVFLRTNPQNARAIRVYEKCGFRKYKQDSEHVYMEVLR